MDHILKNFRARKPGPSQVPGVGDDAKAQFALIEADARD